MSKTRSILSLSLLILSVFSFAQINEVELVGDGIVFPRMNSAQRNALSPVQGQCIFNTQTKALECYDGTQWTSDSGGGGTSSFVIDGDGDTSIELEQNPDEDIIRFHADGLEVMNHDGQTLNFTNSGQSVFIGEDAGATDNLNNNRNTFIGSLSGQANMSGTQNVALGHQALKDNVTGSSNVALGQQALQKNKNSNNIAIGFNAARDNNNGNKNIAIGGFSGFANQNGNQNTLLGYEAGRNLSNTSGSVMIGHQAGMNETDDNRLYIANDNTAAPLVYGEFDNKQLKVNGRLAATDRINVGDDSSTPETGDIRYNVNTEDFEGWNGYQWLSLTKKSPEYGLSVRDNDFNFYRTIKLGTQLWMAENLKVTTYNDGTVIPNITGDTDWSNLISGAWCHYDNDPNYDDIYGKLYNAHAIQTDKLCPVGWHIPSQSELFRLISYLGVDGTGGKMKEAGLAHWDSPNTAANDASGFTGLPGGQRKSDGSFSDLNSLGIWWQDQSLSSAFEFKYMLEADAQELPVSFTTSTKNGLSVRCLKD